MHSFADKIINFNKNLHFTGTLPEGVHIMNPFRESETAMACSQIFYKKYNDYPVVVTNFKFILKFNKCGPHIKNKF